MATTITRAFDPVVSGTVILDSVFNGEIQLLVDTYNTWVTEYNAQVDILETATELSNDNATGVATLTEGLADELIDRATADALMAADILALEEGSVSVGYYGAGNLNLTVSDLGYRVINKFTVTGDTLYMGANGVPNTITGIAFGKLYTIINVGTTGNVRCEYLCSDVTNTRYVTLVPGTSVTLRAVNSSGTGSPTYWVVESAPVRDNVVDVTGDLVIDPDDLTSETVYEITAGTDPEITLPLIDLTLYGKRVIVHNGLVGYATVVPTTTDVIGRDAASVTLSSGESITMVAGKNGRWIVIGNALTTG